MSSDTTAASQRLENWLTQGEGMPKVGTRFAGVGSLGRGLLLSAMHDRQPGPWLVVFASNAEARSAVDHIKFFGGEKVKNRIHYLPSLDFDYYRGLLPNPERLCERNVALFHAMNDPGKRIFITTVSALLQKGLTPAEFLRATQVISPNDILDRDALVRSLVELGYQRQPAVYDPGVFAVRGAVVDVFCPLYPQPLRIEFFGDLIDEIRFFDPKGQRSLEKLEQGCVIPVGTALIPHGEDFLEASGKIKERLDSLGVPKSDRDEIIEKIHNGMLPTELGFLFPLLSKGSAPLMDYFPAATRLVWDGKDRVLESAQETELPKLEQNHALFEKEPIPIASRESLFVTAEAFRQWVDPETSYFFEDFESQEGAVVFPHQEIQFESEREVSLKHKGGSPPLDGFAKRFRAWMDEGYRIHIVCHTQMHAERTRALSEPYGLFSEIREEGAAAIPGIFRGDFQRLHLWVGFLNDSQLFPSLRIALLSEEEIFGKKKRTARASAQPGGTDAARMLSTFRDLKVSDFIVHKDHGIGRYLGLKSMDFQGQPNDYVILEYKDGDKLYIPIYRLNVLQKYVGGEGNAPVLDKLGGDRWAKARGRAARAIAELAAEFLEMQAKRKLTPAHAFSAPGAEYQQFEMEFPFDETPDQMKAIGDVNHDLSQAHPMDRLVCGDVGYGKTEVAMRAAYRCLLDKKQVTVLVPTTVLAFQHNQTFLQRFGNTGVRIETISRLKTNAQIKGILQAVKEGRVDILIGTHRLLSADVAFHDLGLVIVDEEHRFGVVHKERLKKISASVHYLSMTATPIPRTLNMAMTGIKDISIITTPPPDRLSVRTFVCRRTPEVMAEAITNELRREGQVFFVHNRIQSLYRLEEELHQLLPKIKIETVHGQMDPEDLERKMLLFYRGEAQVLLTTAIIESGLDIPRANTILIDDADHFGLAQMYQLRGRVGRSAQRAYCYLLVPAQNLLTEEAKQRLQVIQRYAELGGGFNIASHDLELRGSGDLLGKDQSGHLNAIGVDFYFQLLEESMRDLRGEERLTEIEPEINLRIAAYFPEEYLPDIGEKVQLYRKLSAARSEEEISEIEQEIRDRLGPLPEEVVNLLGLMTLKIFLKALHVVRMSCGPKKTSLQFAPSTPASPAKIVSLVQRSKGRIAVTPDHKLVYPADSMDWKVHLKELQALCHELGV